MNTTSTEPQDSQFVISDEIPEDRNIQWFTVKKYYLTHNKECWVNLDYVRHLSSEVIYFKDGYDERGKIIRELRQRILELEGQQSTHE